MFSCVAFKKADLDGEIDLVLDLYLIEVKKLIILLLKRKMVEK